MPPMPATIPSRYRHCSPLRGDAAIFLQLHRVEQVAKARQRPQRQQGQHRPPNPLFCLHRETPPANWGKLLLPVDF